MDCADRRSRSAPPYTRSVFYGRAFHALGHTSWYDRRLPVQDRREAVDDRDCAGVIHLGQDHKAGGAFYQRPHRRTIAGALNEIAFPVAGNDPVFDLGRTDVNAMHVLALCWLSVTAWVVKCLKYVRQDATLACQATSH
jgi:hypothetical protein